MANFVFEANSCFRREPDLYLTALQNLLSSNIFLPLLSEFIVMMPFRISAILYFIGACERTVLAATYQSAPSVL